MNQQRVRSRAATRRPSPGSVVRALRNVLISGAGIAGSIAAYWLARQGFAVTVVERAAGLRSSGSPVDVRGRADGVHSQVRALAFGPEAGFVRHLGRYVATLPLPDEAGPDLVMYNAPGKALAIHPARGRAIAAFLFHAPEIANFDHRDLDQHKRLLLAAYSGADWRVPELLEHVRVADDLYFDAVSRVHIEDWSRGRVTLVGDAASCVSLFGDGSSLAMMGGYTLAQSLTGDLADGLRAYQSRHRPRTDPKERGATMGARLLVPTTTAGIRARNLAAHLWPAIALAQRIGRSVSSETLSGTIEPVNPMMSGRDL